MILQEDHASGEFQIRAYKPGKVTINETAYTRSLILTQTKLISDWRPQSIAEIQESDWDPILELKPDFLIFGCGSKFTMPANSLFAPLYQNNISVEVMDNGAACRTFMALAAENRNVAVAMLFGKEKV